MEASAGPDAQQRQVDCCPGFRTSEGSARSTDLPAAFVSALTYRFPVSARSTQHTVVWAYLTSAALRNPNRDQCAKLSRPSTEPEGTPLSRGPIEAEGLSDTLH